MYRLPDSLPTDSITELAPGTSLLISGPSMSGKRELALDMLVAGHAEADGLMIISTQNSATALVDQLERRVETLDRDRVGIIDCSGSETQQAIGDISTQRVSSPGDLTGISIGTVKLMQEFGRRDVSDVRHGLVSVSTLLQYLDAATVFKFIHIYTRRIAGSDGLGIFTVDDRSHDPQTLNTVRSEFDGVIELRLPDEGGREVRIQGFSGTNTGWVPY